MSRVGGLLADGSLEESWSRRGRAREGERWGVMERWRDGAMESDGERVESGRAGARERARREEGSRAVSRRRRTASPPPARTRFHRGRVIPGKAFLLPLCSLLHQPPASLDPRLLRLPVLGPCRMPHAGEAEVGPEARGRLVARLLQAVAIGRGRGNDKHGLSPTA